MNRNANARSRPRRQRQRERRTSIVRENAAVESMRSKVRAALIEVERDWWERQS